MMNKKIIFEGEGAAAPAGDSGAGIGSESSGISSGDVTGNCDHKEDGYCSSACFHIPFAVMPMLSRWSQKYKKSKKNKKNKKYYNTIKVIKNYDDLTEGVIDNDYTLVFNLLELQILHILDNSIINNKRFDRALFLKYFGSNDYEFIGLFSKDAKKCLSLAVLLFDAAEINDCYICEILTLEKGYGKKLLLEIFNRLENVWLMANPTSDERLKEYYRSFKLNEYIVVDSIYDCSVSFFYDDDCDEVKLRKHIDDTYSLAHINESKNKIIKDVNVIKQKQKSFKPTTEHNKIKNDYKKKKSETLVIKQSDISSKSINATPIVNSLRSKNTHPVDKSTKTFNKTAALTKFKNKSTLMNVSLFERSYIKDKNVIEITKDYVDVKDYKVGDIITINKTKFKIANIRNIHKFIYMHPLFDLFNETELNRVSKMNNICIMTAYKFSDETEK